MRLCLSSDLKTAITCPLGIGLTADQHDSIPNVKAFDNTLYCTNVLPKAFVFGIFPVEFIVRPLPKGEASVSTAVSSAVSFLAVAVQTA